MSKEQTKKNQKDVDRIKEVQDNLKSEINDT
jgi:hypothetical protein